MATEDRGELSNDEHRSDDLTPVFEWLRAAPLVRFFRWPVLPLALFLFVLPPALGIMGLLTALFR